MFSLTLLLTFSVGGIKCFLQGDAKLLQLQSLIWKPKQGHLFGQVNSKSFLNDWKRLSNKVFQIEAMRK